MTAYNSLAQPGGQGASPLKQQTTTPAPNAQSYHAYHDDFVDHGRYLRAWSPCTVRAPGARGYPLTKAGLAAWMVALRERGLKRGGINMYVRMVNSYLSWLHAEGHLADRLRVKLLPNPPRPVTTFADAEVRRIIAYRPTNRIETRTLVLVVLLLDTGLRIDEAPGL